MFMFMLIAGGQADRLVITPGWSGHVHYFDRSFGEIHFALYIFGVLYSSL